MNIKSTQPSREIQERIQRLLQMESPTFRLILGGYTTTARWLVEGKGGARAFVKVATTPQTASDIRVECEVYQVLSGPFMPRFLGWQDDPHHPFMAIEDLSAFCWPPPWDAGLIESVLTAIKMLHTHRASLPAFEDKLCQTASHGWAKVAASPESFLSLGIVTKSWLSHALPALINQSELVDTSGNAPIHCDLRSDNICVTRRGAVLIDWSLACLGNAELDFGFWLPSLHAEGGPPPEKLLPNSPGIAAFVSGLFAAKAGLPENPNAPLVRQIQRKQLLSALPWAVRALNLPPMDGTARLW